MQRMLPIAIAMAFLVGILDVNAQDVGTELQRSVEFASFGGDGKDGGGKGFSGGRADLVADVEMNFMRFGRSIGVFDNGGDNGQFDFELTPRVTLGIVTAQGLGLRTRFWDYSHTALTDGGRTFLVDTYNIDVELFERIDLNCNTSLEWSAGVRYNDYIENRGNTGDSPYTNKEGWGGIIGLQLNRQIACGEVYARARVGVLHMEDINAGKLELRPDGVSMQTEIGIGYEVKRELASGRMLNLRAGYEWQQWENYSANNSNGNLRDQAVDVGFDGFVFGAGLEY